MSMKANFRELPRPAARAEVASNIPLVKDLFEVIDRSGLTLTELANKAGVHARTIQNWRVANTNIALVNLQAVAGAVGLDVVLQKKEPKP